jgi:hypothetical protein
MNGLKSIALLGIFVMIMALAGCSEESQVATGPESPVFAVAGADDMANFGATSEGTNLEGTNWAEDVGPGPFYVIKDNLGGDNWFWITVGGPGDYLLEYQTWFGHFSVMFRTEGKASVAIILNVRDNFAKLSIHQGAIAAGLPIVFEEGGVQVFGQLPYNTGVPEGFTVSSTTLLADLGTYRWVNPLVAQCTQWRTVNCWAGADLGDPACGGRRGETIFVRNGCWPFGPEETYP